MIYYDPRRIPVPGKLPAPSLLFEVEGVVSAITADVAAEKRDGLNIGKYTPLESADTKFDDLVRGRNQVFPSY